MCTLLWSRRDGTTGTTEFIIAFCGVRGYMYLIYIEKDRSVCGVNSRLTAQFRLDTTRRIVPAHCHSVRFVAFPWNGAAPMRVACASLARSRTRAHTSIYYTDPLSTAWGPLFERHLCYYDSCACALALWWTLDDGRHRIDISGLCGFCRARALALFEHLLNDLSSLSIKWYFLNTKNHFHRNKTRPNHARHFITNSFDFKMLTYRV